ncbi:MAG: hypothetical protein ACF8XB_08535, partial [Planctomycetota bacterium JB042]
MTPVRRPRRRWLRPALVALLLGGAAPAGVASADDPEALLQRGRRALIEGRLDDAEETFRRLREGAPADGPPYAVFADVHLAIVARQRGRTTEAEEMLRRVLEGGGPVAGPLGLLVHDELAKVLLDRGLAAAALE